MGAGHVGVYIRARGWGGPVEWSLQGDEHQSEKSERKVNQTKETKQSCENKIGNYKYKGYKCITRIQ